MVKRVLVAFDFDHTLIDETLDTYVLKTLPNGADLPPHIKNMYSIHMWNDYQREVFRYLHTCHVTKEQLLSCVDEMPMVKGMRELLEYLTTHRMKVDAKNGPRSVVGGKNLPDAAVQFDVIVLSDANSAIINHVLETVGLQSMFSKVYTNPSSFDNSGCLQLSPYHRQDWCNMSPANMCKGHILDEHCQKSVVKYDVVAFVGDGENDFCPTVRLRETDMVFPRRGFPLDKHITEGRDKVAAMVKPWDTGFDIINAFVEVLMTVKA